MTTKLDCDCGRLVHDRLSCGVPIPGREKLGHIINDQFYVRVQSHRPPSPLTPDDVYVRARVLGIFIRGTGHNQRLGEVRSSGDRHTAMWDGPGIWLSDIGTFATVDEAVAALIAAENQRRAQVPVSEE